MYIICMCLKFFRKFHSEKYNIICIIPNVDNRVMVKQINASISSN